MKRRVGWFVAALGLVSLLPAKEPMLSVGPGEGIPVFLTAAVTARYDDNVLLSETNKSSDTIFVLMPGFELHSIGGLSQASLSINEQFVRYSSHSSLNSNLTSAAGNISYNNAASSLAVTASYQEMDQSNISLRNVDQTVQRNLASVSADGSFGLTAKTSVGTGVSYERTDYPEVGYRDGESWALPVDFYYAMTPKVDLSLGYRYRQTKISGNNNDSKDHFASVGARGAFTPKLSGQIRVGLTQRRFSRGGSDNVLGLGATLNYVITPKTSASLSASNDFTNSAYGTSIKSFRVNTGVQFAFTPQWNGVVGLSYDASRYKSIPTRKDKFTVGNVGLNYVPTTYLAFQLSYIFRTNSSDRGVNFDNNVASLSASVRF